MSHEIRADYSQSFLLPPSMEDWVPADHPARFLREFVDALDLEALGMSDGEERGTQGRPSYAPDLLLKVWLYGYFWGIRSTRRLEAACREQVGLLWLTGMHSPDHNTLWRFFRRHKAGLRRLFKRSVQVAVQADMIGLVLHAVDGTKIAADVSARSAWHQKTLEELLARLDARVAQIEQEIEAGANETAPGYRLPESMAQTQRLRETVCSALAELDRAERKHLHPVDLDARMMARADTDKKTFAYNAQVVVDEASGMIVAQDVVNDETDWDQLAPMLDKVNDTLGTTAETTVADRGYSSGMALKQAEDGGYNAVVNLRANVVAGADQPYHTSHFTYDPEHDCCICPRGERLPYQNERPNRHKTHTVRVYRCHNQQCPVRDQCTKQRRGRTIEIAPYHEAVTRQRTKQRDPKNQAALAKRGRIVEPVFGILKANHQFRRWTLRGLDAVKTQWALLCTVHNLRKLYKTWRADPPAPANRPNQSLFALN